MNPKMTFIVIAAISAVILTACGKKNPAEHIISQKRFENVLEFLSNPKNFDLHVMKPGQGMAIEMIPGPLYNSVAEMNAFVNTRQKTGFITSSGKPEGYGTFHDVTIKSCTAEPKKDKADITHIKCSYSYYPKDGSGRTYKIINAEIDMERDKNDRMVINRVIEK